MNDNAAHNDNNDNSESITVLVRAKRDGRIGFVGSDHDGNPVELGSCAKVIVAAAVAFNGNIALYDVLECFGRALEGEYGAAKAKEYVDAMIAAHNAAAERLKPTADDILQGD